MILVRRGGAGLFVEERGEVPPPSLLDRDDLLLLVLVPGLVCMVALDGESFLVSRGLSLELGTESVVVVVVVDFLFVAGLLVGVVFLVAVGLLVGVVLILLTTTFRLATGLALGEARPLDPVMVVLVVLVGFVAIFLAPTGLLLGVVLGEILPSVEEAPPPAFFGEVLLAAAVLFGMTGLLLDEGAFFAGVLFTAESDVCFLRMGLFFGGEVIFAAEVFWDEMLLLLAAFLAMRGLFLGER